MIAKFLNRLTAVSVLGLVCRLLERKDLPRSDAHKAIPVLVADHSLGQQKQRGSSVCLIANLFRIASARCHLRIPTGFHQRGLSLQRMIRNKIGPRSLSSFHIGPFWTFAGR